MPSRRYGMTAAVDWAAYDLVVVRSAWDYSTRRDEFVAWARSVPRLLNPADVIEWNTDKRYLRTVPRAVATTFVEPGDRWDPPAGEYVVKPARCRRGPGTRRATARARKRRRASTSTALQAAGRTAMVQPYLGAVDAHGETALLFFDGEYSHAIRKGQMLQPGQPPTGDVIYLEEQISARRARSRRARRRRRGAGIAAVAAREPPVCAGGPDPRRRRLPRLVELELTEPSLFLSYSAGRPSVWRSE